MGLKYKRTINVHTPGSQRPRGVQRSSSVRILKCPNYRTHQIKSQRINSIMREFNPCTQSMRLSSCSIFLLMNTILKQIQAQLFECCVTIFFFQREKNIKTNVKRQHSNAGNSPFTVVNNLIDRGEQAC